MHTRNCRLDSGVVNLSIIASQSSGSKSGSNNVPVGTTHPIEDMWHYVLFTRVVAIDAQVECATQGVPIFTFMLKCRIRHNPGPGASPGSTHL